MINIKAYNGTNFEMVSEMIVTMMEKHTFKNVNEKSKEKFLGVFKHVGSKNPMMIKEIERSLAMSDIWLAYDEEDMIGVVRGSKDNIYNLFVKEAYTNQGIGRNLVCRFEEKCRDEGYDRIRLSSTVDAVGFYELIGFKKTTGARMSRYHGKKGYEYQPMMKIIN